MPDSRLTLSLAHVRAEEMRHAADARGAVRRARREGRAEVPARTLRLTVIERARRLLATDARSRRRRLASLRTLPEPGAQARTSGSCRSSANLPPAHSERSSG